MAPSETQPGYRGGLADWVRFAGGVGLLGGVVLALMQGYAPPGPAGDVFRNNLHNDIDATPFFYSESEASYEAESIVREALQERPSADNSP